MKIGDKVVVVRETQWAKEKYYWQPFEITEIRKQSNTVRLKGLCCPNTEILGVGIEGLDYL